MGALIEHGRNRPPWRSHHLNEGLLFVGTDNRFASREADQVLSFYLNQWR